MEKIVKDNKGTMKKLFSVALFVICVAALIEYTRKPTRMDIIRGKLTKDWQNDNYGV